MAATFHPVLELNAALSSFWLTGCGPVSGPSSLKHNTYRVPSCSVTDARLATYPGRSSPSNVWNSPQSSTVANLRPNAPTGTRPPQRTQPRWLGRGPSLWPSPAPSQPRPRPEPAIPARRGAECSRQSRSPHRALLRRIRLGMPNALLLTAAGQYPKAQARRHGTTHPRVVPPSVRDWLDADRRTDRQRGFLIAPTNFIPPCNGILSYGGTPIPQVSTIPLRRLRRPSTRAAAENMVEGFDFLSANREPRFAVPRDSCLDCGPDELPRRLNVTE